MKTLILTGKFGLGHWSAAQSLRQQLARTFPEGQAEVVDFLHTPCPMGQRRSIRPFIYW